MQIFFMNSKLNTYTYVYKWLECICWIVCQLLCEGNGQICKWPAISIKICCFLNYYHFILTSKQILFQTQNVYRTVSFLTSQSHFLIKALSSCTHVHVHAC